MRIQIGEEPALKQRIIRKIDAWRNIRGQECDLLGFGEEIVDIRVERQRPDDLDRHFFFGNDLGRVEHVEVEGVGEFLIEDLDAQFPFGKIAGFDRGPQVAAVEVGIGAVDLDRFVPDHRLEAELGLPVELDEGGFAVGVDQAESVDAKALHHAEGARDRPVGHDPHHHVHAFGAEADEVPEIVMRGLRLRETAIGRRLCGVDQVGEFDRILDEEHRDVVANQIPIAFLSVELGCESAHVACQIG